MGRRTSLCLIACWTVSNAAELPAGSAAIFTSCLGSEQIGVLPAEAAVKVTSSIAGDEGTCFKVSGVVGGRQISGAIFDPAHPAAMAYRNVMAKPATPAAPVPPPTPVPTPAPAAVVPGRLTKFENLKGSNFHDGEWFELARLPSKIVLVHFWDSAKDPTAQKDAEYLAHLRAQYGDRGLAVIGITSETSQDRVRTFNDNAEAVWPLIRDRGALAQKYGVTGSSEILVLDDRRNIITAGPNPPNLEQLVTERLNLR
jgi:peroxiredoxin